MSNFFSFLSGTLIGMYVAQNYQVPDIKNSSSILIKYIKSFEKDYKENDEKNNKN